MKKIFQIVSLCLCMALIMGASSCDATDTHEQAAQSNEESVRNIVENKRFPVLQDSLDWDNVAQRAEFLNQRGRIGWIYIFGANAVLIAEEPVLNKLTSLNTYITPMEEIKGTRSSPITVEAPDLDGTYGYNADGVFWFDPDGVYNELFLTSPIVIYSSERKQYDTPPLLSSHYKGD